MMPGLTSCVLPSWAQSGSVGHGWAHRQRGGKEWWRHRRELYQPILVSLMDLHIHSRQRLRLEKESDPADPKFQTRLEEAIEKAASAMTELQRAPAIAIVLGDDVRTALDELETQWLNATRQKTTLGEAEERYAAVLKVRHSVEATARRHLRS